MRLSLFLVGIIQVLLAMGSTEAFAALVIDSSQSNTSSLATENTDDLPQELFPLTEMPHLPSNTENLRTETHSVQSEEQWHSMRTKVLNDFGSRISADFHITEAMRARTEFWFDIYTRYGQAHHVVHHALYPWIVFKVVDTTETLKRGKGPQWLRQDQGNKFAKSQVAEIRKNLRKLANRKDYSQLTPIERDLYNKLMPIKGPRRLVFRMAAENVRSQLGQKDFFEQGLINSSRYLPYMEEEFRRMGLPTELTRIPFVESSFNEDAQSKAGASGIWQIMPATGKSYMIVNQQIDERNSPLKATVAAGRLLHSYNHALNSWPLTITSYNHGIGNIQKAIHKAKSRDLGTIIARYHAGDFKFASGNYYTCFLAALYAEKYNELLFKETPREPLQEQEILKLSGRTGIKALSKLSGLRTSELLKYNLDLRFAVRTNAQLPRGYQLHLPPGYKIRLLRQVGEQDKKSSRTKS